MSVRNQDKCQKLRSNVTPVVLGIDLGTSSVKCTLLSAQGKQIATASQSYHTSYPLPGYAEQNPHDWYAAVVHTVRTVMDRCQFADVIGIGLCGAAHIPVLLDRHLDVIRPAILWTDQRSIAQVHWLNRTHDQHIMETTFNRASCTWTLPQLMWLKQNEAESLNALNHIVFGKDYIAYRLTGKLIADVGSAAGTMLMDVRKMRWAEDLIDLVGLSTESLPEIFQPQDIIGHVTLSSAQELGLKPGIPVIAGALDSVMELWSLGLTQSGDGMVRMGTAGGVMIVSSTPHPSPGTITYPYLQGMWCTQAFNNACATALEWVAKIISPDKLVQEILHEETNANLYVVLDQMAERVPSGSDGLLFHPFLLGERAPYWDPHLKASFIGATMQHTPAHFVRSVQEGVSFALRDCLELLRKSGYTIERLKLTGGGSKSSVWSQIAADVLGYELIKASSDGSVMGVSMITGVATGLFTSDDQALSLCTAEQDRLIPDGDRHEFYSKAFNDYKDVVSALQPLYRRRASHLSDGAAFGA